jgi:hypothetical protein
MKSFLLLLTAFFTSHFKERRDLALENLALRQQLAILKRTQKRPAIGTKDLSLVKIPSCLIFLAFSRGRSNPISAGVEFP